MSSSYPILDDRPIDQWKVTELKEELKRRRLATKGLKDDLIRRLDEALQIEYEEAKRNAENVSEAVLETDNQSEDAAIDKTMNQSGDLAVGKTESSIDEGDNGNETKGGDIVQQTNVGGEPGSVANEGKTVDINTAFVVEAEFVVQATSADSSLLVTESAVHEEDLSGQELQKNETHDKCGDSNSLQKNEDPRLPDEISKLYTCEPNNQLSEVSPVLDETLKSDSTCSDSVSINENNKLISDDVKLELEVNPDLARPSSRNVDPGSGISHPMDVEEPHESKVSVTGKETNDAENPDVIEKKDIEDMGTSEKLNLDRSSGDDSMEEDAMEGKLVDSNVNSDDVRDERKKLVVAREEEGHADVMTNDSAKSQDNLNKEKTNSTAEPPMKRKIHEPISSGNNEPVKRQRLWNSEGLKVPEQQRTNVTSTTPKGSFQPMKRSFSRSDSTVSDEAPKERIVPPSAKPPTNSLRIDNFLRPFTLKAVQELLGRTGTISSFWMDQIKTHCYVTYSSVEEAMETRDAVYNLKWPVNGGRLLVAEFVDPKEVKMRVEAPPQSPSTPSSAAGPTQPLIPVSARQQQVQRQQLPPPPSLPPPPPLSNPPPVRERLPLPPPPPLPEKVDPPIVTLDDLFRKTKATPRIYFLPLSEEQVAAKLKSRGKNVKQ